MMLRSSVAWHSVTSNEEYIFSLIVLLAGSKSESRGRITC